MDLLIKYEKTDGARFLCSGKLIKYIVCMKEITGKYDIEVIKK